MLIYPSINPVAFQWGALKIHWYGLMYILGFLVALGLGQIRAKNTALISPVKPEQVSDMIFYCALGVIVGGRIGYMLFYGWSDFLADPVRLFKIWQGGMSFHGGLIGVLCAIGLYSLKIKQPFFKLTDFIAPLAPIGLGAGRIGNFINGELWGRIAPADLPWAMIYPHVDQQLRHPSQIYECLLEGVLLFMIVWIFSAKPRPRGAVTGLFLLAYGILRIIAEHFRMPDSQLGFIAFDSLTMGQLLCMPMMILGICFLSMAYQRKSAHV